MPIKIPDQLPALSILRQENIFVMSENRAASQEIRPMEVAILNLLLQMYYGELPWKH